MERPQDLIFQRPKNVGRGRLQDVRRDIPWRYIEDNMGTSIRSLSGTSSGRPLDVLLPSGYYLKEKIKK